MQQTNSFTIYNASAGSGKTFTLVKEYLRIVLKQPNPFYFQHILAITFTNKAAGEMKDRVIANLKSFSEKQENDMFELLKEEIGISNDQLFIRAKAVLNAIMQNYSAFNVTTIDSFTHKLIKSFAYDLNLPMSFDVELDAETLLNEAVDIVLSRIGEDKQLTDLLISFALDKIQSDKSWDISGDLKSFAKHILNENHSQNFNALQKIELHEFFHLKKSLSKERGAIENEFKAIGEHALSLIASNGIDHSDFTYGDLPKHFLKLTKLDKLKSGELKFSGRLHKNIEEQKELYTKNSAQSAKDAIDGIKSTLLDLYYKSEALFVKSFGRYVELNLVLESLTPMAVLSYIHQALQTIKDDNGILLNAEFNQIISDQIKDEPAPFIYEKIGEKFKHYFIDEMQDTSVMQWQNLIPLIGNAISSEWNEGEKGSLLLVGDAKQSIYRWRGGKAEQFIQLSSTGNSLDMNPFYVDKRVENLSTNFRSYAEIVSFNNRFFRYCAKFLRNDAFSDMYTNGNKQLSNATGGGYVSLKLLKNSVDENKESLFPLEVYKTVCKLENSYKKNEICVLVRTKKQGVEVANFLNEKGVEIVSSETLLIDESEEVQFLIHLLKFILNPKDKSAKMQALLFLYTRLEVREGRHDFLKAFVHLNNEDFFKRLSKYSNEFSLNQFIQLPFYEAVEYCARNFGLMKHPDAKIQFFLEVVFEFQQKEKKGLLEFLEYWELKKAGLSIVAPEMASAVRIMTIHKAKGLEFPVVIVPYDIELYRQIQPKTWLEINESSKIRNALVNYSSKLKEIGEKGQQLFDFRRDELELDNFNLLYVALTRAQEQLHIISNARAFRNEESLRFSSELFNGFLKSEDKWNSEQEEFTFGELKRCSVLGKEDETTILQKKLVSSQWKAHKISIVSDMSNRRNPERFEAVNYGNLIHEILSKLRTHHDCNDVLEGYLYSGSISTSDFRSLKEIIQKIVGHPKLAPFFSMNYEILNEREIIDHRGHVFIPDRVLIDQNEAIILDYKTGIQQEKHQRQIANYGALLESLGYSVRSKLLVYINQEILVQEV